MITQKDEFLSGTYLQNSIKINLWRALKQALQGQYKGPQIFIAIVQQHQVVGPLIVRELMTKIQAMNIQEELGENVANMVTKNYQICRCISGMVRAKDPSWLTWDLCVSVSKHKNNNIQCSDDEHLVVFADQNCNLD